MKTMTPLFTLREWRALPEGFPAQLFDGQLLREPSPTFGHQDLVGWIHLRLVSHFGRRHVVLAPADVVIDDHNVLQPDVCVVGTLPAEDSHDVGIPRLVFEVLSPATARRDRTRKVAKYLEAGVAEVWLLDPKAQTIEICRAGTRTTYRGDETARSVAHPDLAWTPREAFARD